MKIKEQAEKLKLQIPAVFLALQDRGTPWYAKVLAGVTVAYALSPIDLIPDFIPILGYLDDLLILPLLITLTVKGIPKSVWEHSLECAENLWIDGKPKKWYFAVPIVLIWSLVILLIIKMFV